MASPYHPSTLLPPVAGSAYPAQGAVMAPGTAMPAYPQGAAYPQQQGVMYPQQQGTMMAPSMPYHSSPSYGSVPLQPQAVEAMPAGGVGQMAMPEMGMFHRHPSPLPPTSVTVNAAPITSAVQPAMAAQPMMAQGYAQPAYAAYPSAAPMYANPGPASVIVESSRHRHGHHGHHRRRHGHGHHHGHHHRRHGDYYGV